MPKTRIGNIPKIPLRPGERAKVEQVRMSRVAGRHPGVRKVVGCMTGTSLDAIDVAALAIDGHGLEMRVKIESQVMLPLGDVGKRLRALAEQQPMTAADIARVSHDFAMLHVEAIKEACGRKKPDLIAVHGQTVFHQPPLSWQVMNPAPIAWAMSSNVVYDMRAMDLAAGGQGAPITPIADWVLFRHNGERRAIINLGGFCNVTRLPAHEQVRHIDGGDVCACNQLLDRMARALLDQPFDRDGQTALRGTVDGDAKADLVRMLSKQADGGRSLGTGDELGEWAERHAMEEVADTLRTACAAIAEVIVAKAQPTDRLVLAGGGVRNRALVEEIRDRCTVEVSTTDDLGVPATLREACAMGILGALCEDVIPITIPRITGVAKAPLSGSWVFVEE
jgi:anhydro-N-acetylmuramic acid kinase